MSKEVANANLIERINSSWRKTIEGVLETAQLCFEADQKLKKNTSARRQFIGQLNFDASTFSKLVTIGGRQELQQEPYRGALPGNYSIVYDVARLKDDELRAALEDGVLTPSLTRKALQSWTVRHRDADGSGANQSKPVTICTLKTTKALDEKKQAALEKSLHELEQKYGLILKRPLDREEQRLNTMDKRVVQRIRSRAQEFVDRLISKARAQADQSGRELSEEDLKEWRFSSDHDKIPKEASWEEIRDHLDRLGHGDQFERLVEEALVLNGVAEDELKDHALADHDDAFALLKSVALRAETEVRAD